MLKRRQLMAFAWVTVAGLPMVLASVPRSQVVAQVVAHATAQVGPQTGNDTAIYQTLHEIKGTRAKALNFDSDIAYLSAQEKVHREALPLRISAPMDRVISTPYRPGTFHKK